MIYSVVNSGQITKIALLPGPSKVKRRTTMPADGVGVFVQEVSADFLRSMSYIEPRPEPKAAPNLQLAYRSKGKTRGRGGRGAHGQRETSSSPSSPSIDQFQIFYCRWHGCTAELHNLSTLKRHVNRIHKQKYADHLDLAIECYWESCCYDNYDLNLSIPTRVVRGTRFGSLGALEDHLEKAHFTPIVQEMGDGPNEYPQGIFPFPRLHRPPTLTHSRRRPHALPDRLQWQHRDTTRPVRGR